MAYIELLLGCFCLFSKLRYYSYKAELHEVFRILSIRVSGVVLIYKGLEFFI